LCYTSLAGRTLDLTWRPHAVRYTDQAKVDGRVVDYLAWPQLQNPWVIQQTNSPHLTLTLGGRRLEYDFAKWTRTLSNPR
jgi:hypothetical protein